MIAGPKRPRDPRVTQAVSRSAVPHIGSAESFAARRVRDKGHILLDRAPPHLPVVAPSLSGLPSWSVPSTRF